MRDILPAAAHNLSHYEVALPYPLRRWDHVIVASDLKLITPQLVD